MPAIYELHNGFPFLWTSFYWYGRSNDFASEILDISYELQPEQNTEEPALLA